MTAAARILRDDRFNDSRDDRFHKDFAFPMPNLQDYRCHEDSAACTHNWTEDCCRKDSVARACNDCFNDLRDVPRREDSVARARNDRFNDSRDVRRHKDSTAHERDDRFNDLRDVCRIKDSAAHEGNDRFNDLRDVRRRKDSVARARNDRFNDSRDVRRCKYSGAPVCAGHFGSDHLLSRKEKMAKRSRKCKEEFTTKFRRNVPARDLGWMLSPIVMKSLFFRLFTGSQRDRTDQAKHQAVHQRRAVMKVSNHSVRTGGPIVFS